MKIYCTLLLKNDLIVITWLSLLFTFQINFMLLMMVEEILVKGSGFWRQLGGPNGNGFCRFQFNDVYKLMLRAFDDTDSVRI